MKTFPVFSVVVSFLGASVCDDMVEKFSYKDEALWNETYPECDGRRQSPININSADVIEYTVLSSFVTFYEIIDQATSVTLYNSGDALIGKWLPPDQKPNVQVKFDNQLLNIDQFRIHWGSEHSIDGKQSDAELQLVTYSDQYESVEEALQKKPQDVKIIALLLEGVDEGAEMMIKVTPYIEKVSEIGSQISIPPGDMVSVTSWQDELYNIFFYEGSITIPPCTESVAILVNKEAVKIPNAALEAIKKTKLKDGVKENRRSQQSVNGREIINLVVKKK